MTQWKAKIQKFMGYALLFFGIFVMVIGIAMMFDEKEEKSQSLSIAVASSAFSAPGVILLVLARKALREKEWLESATSIIKSYRRITLVDLAQKLNVPIPRASRLLSRALALNMIKGHFDRTTDEFFTDEAVTHRSQFRYCPGCGAPLDRVYLEGETIRCTSCGLNF